MDPTIKEHVKRKFNITKLIAKEHTPFLKYPAIHYLEEKHKVDLGNTYRNRLHSKLHRCNLKDQVLREY